MKKLLLSALILSAGLCLKAQSTGNEEFDKKFRFGLRITPQPTWISSSDKNNVANGTRFGFGFGLNMEVRFSEVVGLLTGIGGDFEGGKYKLRNDPASNYQVGYFTNEADEMIELKNGAANTIKVAGNKLYILKDRKVSTTFITIPLILKLSTKEYNGLKYFGLFGGELGFRIKATSTDNYYEVRKYTSDSTYIAQSPEEQTGIDIRPETSLIPIRVGLNVGLGTEYRLAGSTSFFASVNFFRSFTNLMRSKSEFLFYNYNDVDRAKGSTNISYSFVKQNLLLNAVRINVGIMF